MRLATAGLALLVVLAGCSGAIAPPGAGSSDDPGTSTTGEPESIRVVNGSLPFDHEALFAEVREMLAVEAAPPESIRVQRDADMGIQREPMPHFYRIVGIERPAGSSRSATALGYVNGPSAVYVNEKLVEHDSQLRLTLAHEYVHVVQGRTDAFDRLRANVPEANTTDGTVVRRSVLEGGAVMVETRYWNRTDGDGTSPAAGMRRSYEGTSGAKQWVFAPYHYGYRYVTVHANSTTEIEALYDSPPRTSEELIHGLPGGAEPLPPLSVDVERSEWAIEDTDRTGELFVRIALDTELSADTAADAAAGWGTDTRVALANGEEKAYVWALRWDDPANATEFQSAFREYVDARATADGDVWTDDETAFRIDRVDDETVVILLGNESFVRTADVDGSDATVTVSD